MKKYTLPLVLISIILIASALIINKDNNNYKSLQKLVRPAISLYPEPRPIEDFDVIKDDKKSVNISELTKNKWAILYFGYTSCPDVCPVDLSILNNAFSLMKNKGVEMQAVFASIDPKRDIGKADDFAKRFNPNFIGVSVAEENLDELTRSLGVYHEIAVVRAESKKDHSQHGHGSHSEHANHAEHADHSNHANHDDHSNHAGHSDHDDHSNHAGHADHDDHSDHSNHDNHAGHSDHGKNKEQENYLINHTSSYLLLTPDIELIGTLNNPHKPEEIAKALDLILDNL